MRASPFLLAAAIALLVASERDASACGGCFSETTTVVTDHRMILSIAKDQTTLYDQIRYTGEPASFAWVLPIAGTVKIGISADAIFGVLDSQTAVQVIPPTIVCPPSGCKEPAGVVAEESNGGESVQVISHEVVGPYESTQLATSDPQALEKWLADNGYPVPDDVKPVIAAYVNEQFNFLALKLAPGKGVKDMRPVRVTTTGAGTLLPLRMVAAGTGAVVGITLFTVGEGRYEPQGFPSFIVTGDELTWDFAAQKSNFVDVRGAKTAAGGGRAWEIESSVAIPVIQSSDLNASNVGDRWLPEKDSNGNVVKTAVDVAIEDFATLFHGVPSGTKARVTRMRADLAHAALSQDMVLTASADQSELSTVRQATKSIHAPPCRTCDDPSGGASSPASAPEGSDSASSSDSSCAVGAGDATGWASFAMAMVAFALTRRRRR